MLTNRVIGKTVRGYYGPDEDAAAAAAAAAQSPPAGFTQDQVNAFLAKEKRAWQESSKQTVAELQTLKATAGTSQERVTELETTIANLEKTYLTKDELSAREIKKKETEAAQLKESLTKESEFWKNNFSNQLVSTAIATAAASNEAYNVDQMLTLLGGKAKVNHDKDNNKFAVMIAFDDLDKDNKPVVLELTPDAALKRMKELPERFGNLFKGTGGGVGGGNTGLGGGAGSTDLTKIAQSGDAVKYREARKKA